MVSFVCSFLFWVNLIFSICAFHFSDAMNYYGIRICLWLLKYQLLKKCFLFGNRSRKKKKLGSMN